MQLQNKKPIDKGVIRVVISWFAFIEKILVSIGSCAKLLRSMKIRCGFIICQLALCQ